MDQLIFSIDLRTLGLIVFMIVFVNLWFLIFLMVRIRKLELSQECKHSECRSWWANVVHALHLLVLRREDDVFALLDRMQRRLAITQIEQHQTSTRPNNEA